MRSVSEDSNGELLPRELSNPNRKRASHKTPSEPERDATGPLVWTVNVGREREREKEREKNGHRVHDEGTSTRPCFRDLETKEEKVVCAQ